MFKKATLVIGMLLLPSIALWGNTVEIQPGPDIGQDTTAIQYYPDENYGDGVTMWATDDMYSFLRFVQLDGYISYSIDSATLVFWTEGSSSGTERFYRVLEPWNEDTLTWNNQPDHSGDDECIVFNSPEFIGKKYASLVVTWMVRKWLSGEWVNYGWCIIGITGIMQMSTSNCGGFNPPKLVLEGPNLPPLSVQPTSLGKIKSLYSPQQVSSITDGRGQFAKHSKREAWARVE